MSIYTNPAQEAITSPITFLREYHPYKEGGFKNPKFDQWDGRILDIKDNLESAIDYFYPKLDPLILQGVAITVVPGHSVPSQDALPGAMLRLAQRLASNGRIDATCCLRRVKTIAKLATGGDRSIKVHLDSIRVFNPDVIRGRSVLVLDDVSTSGNSCLACRQLLLENGAAEVRCLVLGQTTR